MSKAEQTLLVLLYKRPAMGQGKQRLAIDTNTDTALHLAEALFNCAIDDLKSWPSAKAIAPAHKKDVDWSQALIPEAMVIAQSEGNLGERLNALDYYFRAQGYQRILYIGSDCPELTIDDLQQADNLLNHHDAVLFPATDGGVVLMGCRKPWPNLADLPWSESTLGQSLKQCLNDASYSVHQQGLFHDLDTRTDCISLLPILAADKRPSRQKLQQTINQHIQPILSVIIPCYHDENSLERLLVQLSENTIAPDEVLVIDAAAHSPYQSLHKSLCQLLCNRYENILNVRWIASQPCRGKQLREGAELAKSDVLWFLHADAILDTEATQKVIQSIQQGNIAGYFKFQFDHRAINSNQRLIAKGIERLTRWRNRWGAVYGDQGIFVTRALYFFCGGHAAIPLFEEIALVKALRDKQSLQEIQTGLNVDPRRWQKDGWVYRSLRNRLFAGLHGMGVPASTLAKHYSFFQLRKHHHA